MLNKDEMREIKFRGKRKDNGGWVFGYYFKIWERTYILWGTTNGITNMIEVIPETVGQYTGEKDGFEPIYEDDIVKNEDYITDAHCCNDLGNSVVTWDFESGMWGGLIGEENSILGNIHDNPELLKETK